MALTTHEGLGEARTVQSSAPGEGARRSPAICSNCNFNTIQPICLREKMMAMQVDGPLVACTTDYLINRPQHVRQQDCVSQHSPPPPQGTVLAPFLLCHLQKFADASVTAGSTECTYLYVYLRTSRHFLLYPHIVYLL